MSILRRLLPLAILLPALAACAGDGEKAPPTSDPAESTVSPVKSDCPDCDQAGPSAFVQAGVGASFYAKGDHWQVAVRFDSLPTAEKRDDVFLGEDVTASEVFLFDYAATAIDRDVFEVEQGEGTAKVLRDLATIEITQATPAGPNADLLSAERIDTYEKKVEFVMNDLLEPVRETVYSRRYPNGHEVDLDGKSSLKTGASLFPRTIPRLLTAGQDVPAPALPADLEDVADAFDPTWRDATYKRYDFENGDLVYWSVGRGHLWPFYSRTSQGHAVLVSWNQ